MQPLPQSSKLKTRPSISPRLGGSPKLTSECRPSRTSCLESLHQKAGYLEKASAPAAVEACRMVTMKTNAKTTMYRCTIHDPICNAYRNDPTCLPASWLGGWSLSGGGWWLADWWLGDWWLGIIARMTAKKGPASEPLTDLIKIFLERLCSQAPLRGNRMF
jgi:hypothetical protein